MNKRTINQIERSLDAVRFGRNSPRAGRTAVFAVLGFLVAHAVSGILPLAGYFVPARIDIVFAISAAVVGFKTARFSTNLERLYVLLAEAEPTEVDAFKYVQEAAKRGWRDFEEALQVWIDCEMRRVAPPRLSATTLAKQSFVSKRI